jgi:uncharacterized protein YlzI (FlbEa/FlbD family)
MLIQIETENDTKVTLNVNHIINLEPRPNGGTRVILTNSNIVLAKEDQDALFKKIRSTYAYFNKL